jgi:hypothetical protein
MKKQTAVEWFFDKMKSHFEHDGDLFETACMTYAIAKAMEREQIIDAYVECYMNHVGNGESILREANSVYNKTYGGDQ